MTEVPTDEYQERIGELKAVEAELRLVADTDLPVADRCQRLLDRLEAVRRGQR
jgi:hypothetical protein